MFRDIRHNSSVQFSSVAQSCLTLCDPWTTACQTSLSITNSWSPPKPMSIESVMPSNHLILCRLLLLPSLFRSIRVFTTESVLHIRWPKYWSFSLNISPSNEYSGLIFFLGSTGLISGLEKVGWSLEEEMATHSKILACEMPQIEEPGGLYSQWNFPDQNTGVGNLSILQEIFPSQGV